MKSNYQINIVRSVTKKPSLILSFVFCFMIQCFTGVKSNEIDVTTGFLLTGVLNPPSAATNTNTNANANTNTNTNTNSTTINATAISSGNAYTCALLSTGVIRCWGNNASGQLGLGNNNNQNNASTVSNLDLGTNVTAISSGYNQTCALLSTGVVRCWGANDSGQLGLGNNNNQNNANTVANLNLGTNITAISSGSAHTCALLSTGSVRCWGENSSGQLGLGNFNNQNNANTVANLNLGTNVTAISSTGSRTCALLSTGVVRCWGNSSSGQLGLGNTNNQNNANTVSNLNLGTNVTAISSDSSSFLNTCALLSTGVVRCWGENGTGALGLGNNNTQNNANTVANLNLGTNVTAISSGSLGGAVAAHSCALLSTGVVRCWGNSSSGQLGLGNTNNQNNANTVSNLNLGTNVTAISSGSSHNCALLSTGAVRCWGENFSGQLGLGNNNNQNNANTVSNLDFNTTTTTNSTVDFSSGLPSGWTGNWTVTTTGCASGNGNCLRSAAIGNSNSTSISVTRNVNAGSIRFSRNVSSEATYDICSFFIDGSLVSNSNISGTGSWTNENYTVSAGNRIFAWTYSKDSSDAAGSDACWIDNVVFP